MKVDPKIVDAVYKMLTTQKFADWYEDDFIDHISGEYECRNVEQIEADLDKMLRGFLNNPT